MLRPILCVAAALAVAACGGSGGGAVVATAPTGLDAYRNTLDETCYTVDLFGEVPFASPASDVPAQWRAFSGKWGGGAWQGVWCHDLYVLDVTSSGRVSLIETHAPYAEWGKPATAFRRSGQIGEDGRLRVRYGPVRVEYWVDGDTLYGLRQESRGTLRIAMTRQQS